MQNFGATNKDHYGMLWYFLEWSIAPLNEEHFTFYLQYKYPGTFANRKYEQLSYPKNPKMCDPILVTLLKMQPYYSQSSLPAARFNNISLKLFDRHASLVPSRPRRFRM